MVTNVNLLLNPVTCYKLIKTQVLDSKGQFCLKTEAINQSFYSPVPLLKSFKTKTTTLFQFFSCAYSHPLWLKRCLVLQFKLKCKKNCQFYKHSFTSHSKSTQKLVSDNVLCVYRYIYMGREQKILYLTIFCSAIMAWTSFTEAVLFLELHLKSKSQTLWFDSSP